MFANLIKFITWILPTNAGQGLVIIVAVMAAQPLPVLPVQALWINMTTAVLLGLALAFEPREPGIMRRPPRPPNAPILSGELIFRILLVGLLLPALGRARGSPDRGDGRSFARAGVRARHGQREPLGRNDQPDADLLAVRAPVATVTTLRLRVAFGLALEVGTGYVVEQELEARAEQASIAFP